MKNSKFRAWDKQNKIMHYDFQFIKSGNDNNDWIVFTSDKQKLTDKPHPLNNPYFQQQFVIMENVGINDIYEGDVVDFGGLGIVGDIVDFGGLGIVKRLDEDRFYVDYGNARTGVLKPHKAVGNIYENIVKVADHGYIYIEKN